jgi:predicted dienelactone hydrolase
MRKISVRLDIPLAATVVGLVGGWTSWVDPRIRAVLALSPYVMPFQVRNTLQNIHVPLMYQGGTLDVGITPFLTGANGAYSQSNPPAYFVDLKNAGHLAWVNCGKAATTASCLETKANMKLIDEYGIQVSQTPVNAHSDEQQSRTGRLSIQTSGRLGSDAR